MNPIIQLHNTAFNFTLMAELFKKVNKTHNNFDFKRKKNVSIV